MTTKIFWECVFIKYSSVRSDQLAQEMTDDEECRIKDRRKRERERGRCGDWRGLISEMGDGSTIGPWRGHRLWQMLRVRKPLQDTPQPSDTSRLRSSG